MENTQSTQPIIDIDINDTEKQILVTVNDNDRFELYHILNDLVQRGVVKQYETLDFIIETKTFDK